MRGQARTSGEGALPCLEVLSDLWHLDVRVEFFYLVENMVFVIIATVLERLLLAPSVRWEMSQCEARIDTDLGLRRGADHGL